MTKEEFYNLKPGQIISFDGRDYNDAVGFVMVIEQRHNDQTSTHTAVCYRGVCLYTDDINGREIGMISWASEQYSGGWSLLG